MQGPRAKLHQSVLGRHEQGRADFLGPFETVDEHLPQPPIRGMGKVKLQIGHREDQLAQQRRQLDGLIAAEARLVRKDGRMDEQGAVG